MIILLITSLLLFWCPYMTIDNNVSVQCMGGLLPDIILLTLCDSIGNLFNSIQSFCPYSQCSHLLHVAGRPGSSEVPRNPLTRWDVSSIPTNGIFLTKKLKN